MSDFNIQRETISVEKITGNRIDASFSPAVGNNAAVVYIEAGPNGAAILQKLDEIDGLSVKFVKKVWTATALANSKPRLDISIMVRDNIPEGI